MLFPYYQQQQQQPYRRQEEPKKNKNKNSCSFCGNHEHFIRNCDIIGVTLHLFINTEDKERAMRIIDSKTNSGLQGFLIRLGGCRDNNVRISRHETLERIESIWSQIRSFDRKKEEDNYI